MSLLSPSPPCTSYHPLLHVPPVTLPSMYLLSPSPPCPSCHPPPPCPSCHPPHFLMSPSLSHVTSFHHSLHIPLLHTTMCHTVPPDYHICFPHSLWLKSWSKTVAIFWHNAAETWIDIASATANKVRVALGCVVWGTTFSHNTQNWEM